MEFTYYYIIIRKAKIKQKPMMLNAGMNAEQYYLSFIAFGSII